jgi:hypothetical protein
MPKIIAHQHIHPDKACKCLICNENQAYKLLHILDNVATLNVPVCVACEYAAHVDLSIIVDRVYHRPVNRPKQSNCILRDQDY